MQVTSFYFRRHDGQPGINLQKEMDSEIMGIVVQVRAEDPDGKNSDRRMPTIVTKAGVEPAIS